MTVTNDPNVGNIVSMNGTTMNAGVAPVNHIPSAQQPDEVQPNTTYNAPPNSPDVAAANQPDKGFGPGGQNYVQSQQSPQAQQPHPVSRIFDGILRNLSGPVTVTDPVTGERKDVPQTRGMMGKSILAAALSGLMSGPHYRDTPYGPARDSAADIASGAKAGVEYQQKRQEAAQKLTNDQQAAKLMTLQNNFNFTKMMAMSAHMKHEALDESLKDSQEFNSVFTDYDKIRTGDMPTAYVQQDLLKDDVLNGGHSLSDSNVVLTGQRNVWNQALGQMEPEPTYSILNPALKDITLSKNVTDKLAEMGSQWTDIHSRVGGTVKVPVNAYVHAMHDYQAVTMGESELNSLSTVGGKAGVNLAAAIKKDPTLLDAVRGLTEPGASGAVVSNAPQEVLKALLQVKNGAGLLKLIGITPEQAFQKARDIDLENERKEALAKSGGIGDKAIMPNAEATLRKAAADLNLSPAQQELAIGKVPPQGMTVGEYKQTADKIQAQANENQKAEEAKLKDGGDPVLNQKVANNIVEGDVGKLTTLPVKGMAREDVMSRIHDEAARRGLDTTRFQPAALENKSNTYNDFYGNKKGTSGAQIASFNAFLKHTANAYDATDRLSKKTFGNTGIPMWNVAMDKLGKEVRDDVDWKAFQTALIPVQQEISNFLAAGYATKSEDVALMHQVLDPHETPARIKQALKTLAETADARLTEFGENYRNAMDTTYPNLLTDASRNTLRRLGVKSDAAPLSVNLPKGWQGDHASPMTPQMVTLFLGAAGGNKDKAIDLAKMNGWR